MNFNPKLLPGQFLKKNTIVSLGLVSKILYLWNFVNETKIIRKTRRTIQKNIWKIV